MTTPASVIMEKIKDHMTYARQHETIRTSLVTITAAIAGAVLSFSGSSGSDPLFRMSASVFLIFLGLFSAVFSYKHYERFRYHIEFAKAFDKLLLELVPEANLQNYKCIKRDHASKFPRLSRTHLHVGWTALPVLIAVIGAIMVARQITC